MFKKIDCIIDSSRKSIHMNLKCSNGISTEIFEILHQLPYSLILMLEKSGHILNLNLIKQTQTPLIRKLKENRERVYTRLNSTKTN